MSKNPQDDSILSIIQKFYNKAKGHSAFYDSDNDESRNLEAFLLLSITFEKILIDIGSSLLHKNDLTEFLKIKRSPKYNLNNAINDIYLLGEISTEEFKKIDEFRKDRNNCMHKIFNKKHTSIEKDMKKLFKKHSATFEDVLGKFNQYIN